MTLISGNKIIDIFLAPLTPGFGVLLILAGLYSLRVNASDASRRNHRLAEKACRYGGWAYIALGLSIIIFSWNHFQ